MPARRVSAAVSPLLRLVDWVFSPTAPGIDLFMAAIASGWFTVMVSRPQVFDAGNYRGMQWAPDWAWMVFVGTLVLTHLAGLIEQSWTKLRTAACLLSAWYWIIVAISLSRPGLTTGSFTYSIFGVFALVSAVYVSGRPAPTR